MRSEDPPEEGPKVPPLVGGVQHDALHLLIRLLLLLRHHLAEDTRKVTTYSIARHHLFEKSFLTTCGVTKLSIDVFGPLSLLAGEPICYANQRP